MIRDDCARILRSSGSEVVWLQKMRQVCMGMSNSRMIPRTMTQEEALIRLSTFRHSTHVAWMCDRVLRGTQVIRPTWAVTVLQAGSITQKVGDPFYRIVTYDNA